jgi:hypothetical protein
MLSPCPNNCPTLFYFLHLHVCLLCVYAFVHPQSCFFFVACWTAPLPSALLPPHFRCTPNVFDTLKVTMI